MPRPRKCRMVGFVPNNSSFYPELQNLAEVVLSIEEVEAIRLSDYMGMEQDAAADSMKVSRGTFQRMINSARNKMADALVHGKRIRINGGNFELEGDRPCCRRHGNSCRHRGCQKCEECKDCNK